MVSFFLYVVMLFLSQKLDASFYLTAS